MTILCVVGRLRSACAAVALAGGACAAIASEEGPKVEGAVGLLVRHGPAFPGASDSSTSVTPAGFVRYGRLTLTGAGGFTTRRDEDVERGLSAEIARRGHLRLGVSLRYDNGRQASDSAELIGMGDIRATLRMRLSARWTPEPDWRVAAGLSVDSLRRGGGYFADLSVSRRWVLGPQDALWATVALTGAGDRYLQAWHGVTPQQSAASGLPVFIASEGLRDVSMSLQWRSEWRAMGQSFGSFLGAGHDRLLGSAADSPLTKARGATSASGGLVWRF